MFVDATPSPLDRAIKLDAGSQLGNGLVRPFQRDAKSDFANASGVDLVKACVGQILGMVGTSPKQQGELEWDPERGSVLYLLRHQQNNLVLQELGRLYVVDALRKWEPRIRVKRAQITRDRAPNGQEVVLSIRLLYDVLATNDASNAVAFENIDQTINLPQAA